MHETLLVVIYLLSSILFIISLKMQSYAPTAHRGNALAATGMAIAIAGTLVLYGDENGTPLQNYPWIFGALLVGGILGWAVAQKVAIPSMPQLINLFNAIGGACAVLMGVIEFNHLSQNNFTYRIFNAYTSDVVDTAFLQLPVRTGTTISLFLQLITGAVAFAGSIVIWGKINGSIKNYFLKKRRTINLLVWVIIINLSAFLTYQISMFALAEAYGEMGNSFLLQKSAMHLWFYVVLLLSLAYGVLFVLPVDNTYMPAVKAVLNSFTGVAVACSGFLYNNKIMLTGGILVGAAGIMLTVLICRTHHTTLKRILTGAANPDTR